VPATFPVVVVGAAVVVVVVGAAVVVVDTTTVADVDVAVVVWASVESPASSQFTV